jgi:hypothetical protein
MSENLNGPRKSVVTIGVKRLLNTAQFENLEVKLETTEEIFWDSLAERQKKIDSLAVLLNDQYSRTQTAVLRDLGVDEKRAWIKAPASTSSKPANHSDADALLR